MINRDYAQKRRINLKSVVRVCFHQVNDNFVAEENLAIRESSKRMHILLKNLGLLYENMLHEYSNSLETHNKL